MDTGVAKDNVRQKVPDALHDSNAWRISMASAFTERSSVGDNDNKPLRSQFWSSSFQEQSSAESHQESASFAESVNGGAPNDDNLVVSADQERQFLLLMLLGHVCALHDPTPRTFTVHVLDLFERGILDRESIRFLFELGMMPAAGSPTSLLSFEPTNQGVSVADSIDGKCVDSHLPETAIQKWTRDIVPVHPALDRVREASAIRIHLQQQESLENGSKKKRYASAGAPPLDPSSMAKSWKVNHHPLNLSRYQREFTQIRLLAGGSFGQVFQATSKLDGRDYAVKKVAFSATGYSNESVTQVIREVRCLAHCDHPNCVRYYTSWLEPDWMTGGGTLVAPDQIASQQVQQKLITGLNQLVITGGAGKSSTLSESDKSFSLDRDNENSYEPTPSSFRRRRRFSFSGSMDDSMESLEHSQSDFWSKSGRAKDDSFLSWERSESIRSHKAQTNGTRKQKPPPKTYRYQICLYIQMQLCLPMTLADWIRQRNQSIASHDHATRIGPAMDIVMQLIRGLAHVHAKDIIHRDLKPGNIFTSNDGNFCIGDFGLSKLIRSANSEEAMDAGASIRKLLLPATGHLKCEDGDTSVWEEPLTAGVGTASYAAPEQVASDKYGSEIDIFSLGLIMLELVCCFDTEHERIQTFQDCRRGDLPSWLVAEYPLIASLIQRCTDYHPRKRPSAKELLSFNLKNPAASIESQETMEQLRGQLKEKEQELEHQKNVIAEKDKLIEELQRQMEQIHGTGYVANMASDMGNEELEVVVDASYSSDDDDY